MRLFSEAGASTLGLPPETFIYNAVSVGPPISSSTKDALSFVAASSNNALTLFTLRNGSIFSVQHTVENAHKSISCLQACLLDLGPGYESQHIVTAGRDGHIKFWSLATFMEGHVSLQLETTNGQGISAMAQNADKNIIAAGTELQTDGPGDVAIYVWKLKDSASKRQPILAFTESHTDTITNLSFHVSFPAAHEMATGQPGHGKVTHLVTSSTDGLINVFDLTQADEDDAVVSIVNTRSAVQYFLCINDTTGGFGEIGGVCAISQDEKIAIHSLASVPDHKADIGSAQKDWDIREQLHCDYAVDLRLSKESLESESPNDDTVILAVGACKSETTTDPRLDIYVTSRSRFGVQAISEPAVRLCGAHGEEIVRDVWLHEECPFILTCGEDGHVRVWLASDSARGGESVKVTETVESKPKKKKKSKGKERSDARFKPY